MMARSPLCRSWQKANLLVPVVDAGVEDGWRGETRLSTVVTPFAFLVGSCDPA